MKKIASILLFLFIILTPLSFSEILQITVDAPIHPVTSEYIRNAIDRADDSNMSLIIMVINTPGGLDTSMREIIERILSAKTPVAAYVSPSGARSASAGFLLESRVIFILWHRAPIPEPLRRWEYRSLDSPWTKPWGKKS